MLRFDRELLDLDGDLSTGMVILLVGGKSRRIFERSTSSSSA